MKMKMKMKRSVSLLICLCMLLAMGLPQTQTALAAEETAPDGHLAAWGSPEPAGENAIRIYWGMDSVSADREYRIAWKKSGDGFWEEAWKTVEITGAKQEEDGSKSYCITGLEKNQKYDITVEAILRNEKGEKVYSRPLALQGCTCVQAPKYEPYSAASDGSCIESVWNVYEKNGVVKFYRADERNGEYILVGETDGRENLVHTNFKYKTGKIVFRDENVMPGRTYYYKAVSQVKADNGTVMESDMESEDSKACQLTSRKKPYGDYAVKLLNKKGTYAKTLTWKITADKSNYLTNFVKKDIRVLAKSSKTGNVSHKKPVKIQWSADGKSWTTARSTIALYQGRTIYLRVTLSRKMWIRGDGADALQAGIRYYYYDKRGSAFIREHSQVLRADMNNRIELESADGDDDPGYDWDDYWDDYDMGEAENWENIYEMIHSHDMWYGEDLTVETGEDQTAVLKWRLCPMAEGYLLRYGRTQEEAEKAELVLLPAGQYGYEVKGLEKGKDYCFSLTERYRDEETGKLVEKEREYGTVMLPAEGWNMTGRTYHSHLRDDLHGNVDYEDETAVVLTWFRCPQAEGYKIYYGTSEEAAKSAAPLVIDEKGMESCMIKNLKKGETYYFFLAEITEDENGVRHEDFRLHGKLKLEIPI